MTMPISRHTPATSAIPMKNRITNPKMINKYGDNFFILFDNFVKFFSSLNITAHVAEHIMGNHNL